MNAYTGHVSALPATLAAMRRTLKPMPSGHAEGFRDYVAAAGLTDLAHWINALPRDEDFALERIDIPIAGLRAPVFFR